MTISANAWLNRLETKRHIGANLSATGDVDKNLLIDDVINSACAAIVKEIGRPVVKATYTDFYDPIGGSDTLLLYCPPASVTTVWEDSSRTFATPLVSGTDYAVPDYKQGEGQGVGLGRKIVRLNGKWSKGVQTVKVLYAGGWDYTVNNGDPDNPIVTADNVPAPIRKAALLAVQWIYNLSGVPSGNKLGNAAMSGQQVGSVTNAVRGASADTAAGVPAEAKELVREYRWRIRDDLY